MNSIKNLRNAIVNHWQNQPRDPKGTNTGGRWTDGSNNPFKSLEKKHDVKIKFATQDSITANGDLGTAYYDRQTDTVFIDKNFFESASQKKIDGVIAHESYHAHEDQVDKQLLKNELKKQTDEYLQVAGEDLSYDEKAAYENDYRLLIWELGGSSPYANQYFTNRVLGFDRAVSESLAEVARQNAEGKKSGTFWDDIYDIITK